MVTCNEHIAEYQLGITDHTNSYSRWSVTTQKHPLCTALYSSCFHQVYFLLSGHCSCHDYRWWWEERDQKSMYGILTLVRWSYSLVIVMETMRSLPWQLMPQGDASSQDQEMVKLRYVRIKGNQSHN